MNDEEEIIWKQQIVELLLHHFHGGTVENHEMRQDSRHPGQELNRTPPEWVKESFRYVNSFDKKLATLYQSTR
jgi:hypothetical protein